MKILIGFRIRILSTKYKVRCIIEYFFNKKIASILNLKMDFGLWVGLNQGLEGSQCRPKLGY